MRTIHYVAPSVWAWRVGPRGRKWQSFVDHVLALLPFEPPYMVEAAGMTCDFVGHPVVSEPQATEAESRAFRDTHGIGAAPLILVLPGSRRAEVARLAPIFGESLRATLAKTPKARIVVPAADAVASAVLDAVATWPGNPIVLDPRGAPEALRTKRAAFAADRPRACSLGHGLAGTCGLGDAHGHRLRHELVFLGGDEPDAEGRHGDPGEPRQRDPRRARISRPRLQARSHRQGPHHAPDRPGRPNAQRAAMQDVMQKLGAGADPPGLRAARSVIQAISAVRQEADLPANADQ